MQLGLIGARLGHSYSKLLHEQLSDLSYTLCELTADALPAFFAARDFVGINVTIPYKQTVMAYCDALSPAAREIGAVNTIVNRGGVLYGDNTDFAGLAALLHKSGIGVRGKKVLILGTGGTSKTALAVARALGAASVSRVSRHPDSDSIGYETARTVHRDAEVLINTTPVGMFPDCAASPVDLDAFPALCGVADVIYHPLRSRLVLQAQARGIPAVGGLYMLTAQAVYAQGVFFDKPPQTGRIDALYRSLYEKLRCIVLIGMPGAGKSTVGRALSREYCMPLVDTDTQLEEQLGMPIADYFAACGEKAFREKERALITALAGREGRVIATGGGAVTSPDCAEALRQCGTVIYLDRPTAQLTPTESRPTANSRAALEKRYAERHTLYRDAADIIIQADGSVADVTAEIRQALDGKETTLL